MMPCFRVKMCYGAGKTWFCHNLLTIIMLFLFWNLPEPSRKVSDTSESVLSHPGRFQTHLKVSWIIQEGFRHSGKCPGFSRKVSDTPERCLCFPWSRWALVVRQPASVGRLPLRTETGIDILRRRDSKAAGYSNVKCCCCCGSMPLISLPLRRKMGNFGFRADTPLFGRKAPAPNKFSKTFYHE